MSESAPNGGVEPLSSFEAHTALKYVEKLAEMAGRTGQAYLATVVAEADGQVQIARAGDDASDDETYARCAGFGVLTNDIVLVVDVGGKEPIVIARVEATAPSFEVMRHALRFWSGADIAGYSDAGSTQTWSIDGATGAAVFGSANTPVVDAASQSNATSTNTTSTTIYEDAATLALALPVGTWSVTAIGGLGAKHSGDDAVSLVIEINGTLGTARTLDCQAATFRTIVDNATVTGIAGGGSINVKVRFRSSDAGTTTVNNPWVIAIATRTA